MAKPTKKKPESPTLPEPEKLWCADWLFSPKVEATKKLPVGCPLRSAVRATKPERGDPPFGGGRWVLAVPPAWVK